MTPAAKKQKHDEIKEDRISKLSEDILLSILCRLGMKDATKTSILSRRWRYLSTYLTSLDFFGDFKTMPEKSFLNRVNQVVSLHRASSIIDFRVSFPLINSHANHIDKWVEFAVSKRVKNLVLDFDITRGVKNLMRGSEYIQEGDPRLTPYTLRLCANGVHFLSSLCLRGVSISEELLELLISRSHLLERLVVEESHDLVHLKVTNSSRLKHLAIRNCEKLIKLVVDVANLVSFEFETYHKNMDVVYHNVPSLIEAKFGGQYSKGLVPDFQEIACFSAHLTKLSLVIDMIGKDVRIPPFGNVKHLDLRVGAKRESVLALRHFAVACPWLLEFKLQVYWPFYGEDEDLDMFSEYYFWDARQWLEERNEEHECNFTLPHLRKLELVGCFRGHVNAEMSLALYIVKNANKLEKFICDPRDPFGVLNMDKIEASKIEASREHARELAMVIPSSVDLVIM